MIKEKNMGEELFMLRKAGSAAVAADIDNFNAPFSGFITGVYASFGKMGTDGTGSPTQDVLADVLKNGTTIFSGATKINWTHALQVGTANTPISANGYAALTTNPTPVNKGDKINIAITQILNGTSPVQPLDLTIHIVLAKKLGQSAPSAMLGGSVDVNN